MDKNLFDNGSTTDKLVELEQETIFNLNDSTMELSDLTINTSAFDIDNSTIQIENELIEENNSIEKGIRDVEADMWQH